MACDRMSCFLENLNVVVRSRLGGVISRVHCTAWHVSQMDANIVCPVSEVLEMNGVVCGVRPCRSVCQCELAFLGGWPTPTPTPNSNCYNEYNVQCTNTHDITLNHDDARTIRTPQFVITPNHEKDKGQASVVGGLRVHRWVSPSSDNRCLHTDSSPGSICHFRAALICRVWSRGQRVGLASTKHYVGKCV